MPDGKYRAFIDSELFDGVLNYADLVIPGESEEELLFSTYICHPSMANNEVSGIVMNLALARYVQEHVKHPRYTYRFVFVPETIGSILYIKEHLNILKHLKAGFILSCVGDDRAFSHIESRQGNTFADKVIKAALVGRENVKRYSFLQRGSDERQYCSPLVNLPVCGFSPK